MKSNNCNENLQQLLEYAEGGDMKVLKDVVNIFKDLAENEEEEVVRAVTDILMSNESVFMDLGFEVFDSAMNNEKVGCDFRDELSLMKEAYYVS